MFTRILALSALAALSLGTAHAGSLQNGTYTPNCTDPGNAPAFSSKSPDAYNKSAKEVQAWADSVKAYQTCLQNETKADQGVMIEYANAKIKTLSDQMNGVNTQSQEAMAKLKKQTGGK